MVEKLSRRIMVVEDEQIIAEDLRDRLKVLGYEVVGIAATGAAAIAMVEVERPDLVLMDIELKGESDGIKTAEQIRTRLQIPVVYLTAHSDRATLDRAKLTEPYGYLIKPVEDRELHVVIEVALYRSAMDRRLRESERRLAIMLNSIGDAVISTNDRGAVTFLNPVAVTLTGWNPQEAAGRDITEVFHIRSRETNDPIESPVRRALAEKRIVELPSNTKLVARDGKEISIDDSAAPTIDDAGAVTGAVLVFRDISERQQLEEQLRQSQKMEAIGRLAGGLAHDFNNMMTAVIGQSDMLLRQIDPDHPFHEKIGEIKRAGERAAALTAQLLAFSRKQVLQPEVLEINRLVQELEEMLRRLIGEDIDLVIRLDETTGKVKADPNQLQQVILNLVVNARDAMPEGGRLVIETSNAFLDEAYANRHAEVTPGAYVKLAISDTGHGIAPEVQAHIFEPFFTTKPQGAGTGLGLSMVYGIVKQSGGHIWVYSEPGFGTTFKIYLPRTDEVAEVVPLRAEWPELPRGTETVLLVEDEELVRDLVRELLEVCGYRVLEAADGEAAIELFEREQLQVDLLITDLVMPRIGGRQLAERLRALRPEIKILYMSGYTDDIIIHRGVMSESAAFIQKPFTLDDLARRVREILDAPGHPHKT
jgi:PAS domain S-box-containing protein